MVLFLFFRITAGGVETAGNGDYLFFFFASGVTLGVGADNDLFFFASGVTLGVRGPIVVGAAGEEIRNLCCYRPVQWNKLKKQKIKSEP